MALENMHREALSQLMVTIRPRLHRYCARMVGSVFEGEDIVQEALARAAEALPSSQAIHNAESWLFTIAHNAALDALRRRKRRDEVPLDLDAEPPQGLLETAAEADSWIAATADLAVIMRLPVVQRATVVLVDVLEYSLAETVAILSSTLPAVKAALHRGRARLKLISQEVQAPPPELDQSEQRRLRSYADRFNAREFDILRDLLAEDVRLDLVNRLHLTGNKDVAEYFTRYDQSSDWKLLPALAEGQPVLLVCDPASAEVEYVVLLEWKHGQIYGIRDFRYARYITDGLEFVALPDLNSRCEAGVD